MNFGRISVAAALLCLSLVTHVPGQQGGRASTTAHLQQGEKDVSVTITEPGSYTLAQLYKAADIVALVKVIAADDESYLRPVYKSKVIAGFRGVREGQTLYFGRFTHNKLGAEYFVFLKSEKQPLAPNNGSAAGFGTVPYAVDFDDGFTVMESSYQCAFPGKKSRTSATMAFASALTL